MCGEEHSWKGYVKFSIVLCIFSFVLLFRCYVIDRIIVQGNSMDNTFSDGDVLWAKKFTLQKSIERYSVIIAKVNRKLVIKRIVGLPEEKIKILNGYVFVNGQQLENDYGYQTNISGIANKELVLEDNQYFLLGDNRNCSIDSRIWGAINLDQIKGIVIYRFFPFWKMQSIH